ncbi:c-type cytochrome [Xanthobacter autotrophicus]|uniref:c-type cytochrome n=1 Tax=Xanthobacter TaxID=279 RepID=UPI0024AC1667|nr:c-type cytochrome [Xanthobacter autotrophicus]MDI4663088.1 c-type cytochrome [Xanthobacter autotrophicus]
MMFRPAQRMTVRARLMAAGALVAATPALAAGDREFGAYLAGPCVTCHQPSGQGAGGIPVIAGWPPEQFIAVMDSYRRKQREHAVMRALAAALSDEEIAALAAYFAELEPAPR